jgi:type I restriction enzyme S subunit
VPPVARSEKTGDLRVDQIMPEICPLWAVIPFEECLHHANGKFKKLKKKDIKPTGRIPVVDQGETFIPGYIDNETDAYEGSLPVIIFGDHTRRLKFIDFHFAVGADGTKILKPIEYFNPKFFYFYLRSLNLESQGYSRHYRFLKQTKVPIPSHSEQRRIVAKLEKLLVKVDACKERLEKVPAILKRFRQSVLAAACSGRLTADWRENDQKRKDAFTLLELNVLEREKKFKNECEIALNTGNGPPRPYPVNLEPIDYDELDCLPDTWKWERLINIAHVVGGVTKGRKLKSEQVITLPYLRVANVQDGYIDFSEIKEIEALREDLQKYRLRKGDILFTEGGDRDKLGRGTVWDGSIENCIHQNHIFRARLYCSKILPEYISLATKSEHSKRYFFNNASQTVNLASINKITLGNLPIAIPPDDEQHEIVRRVEALFKIADDIEKRYQKAKAHVDKLTQPILAKAFRGELVPQDPNDEPAAELLKRIQAERKNQEAETRPGRKSTGRRVTY